MRMRIAGRVVFACAMMFCSSVWAWNGTGHEAVADIAWDNLTPAAKAKVTELLKAHPDYARALTKETTAAGDKDRQAFMVAATWPDLIRSASFGKSHELAHSNWHYIDIPYVIGDVKAPTDFPMTWDPAKDKEPGNAIQAIKKNAMDLRNGALSPAERAMALCWVEHLVGDIHQPLHAVSLYSAQYPQGDRGGNSMIVRVVGDGSDGRTSNLHSYWDGLIGGYIEIGEVEKIATQLEKDHPRKEFEKELGVKDVDQWALASLEEAKHVVYGDGKLPGVPQGRRGGDGNASQPGARGANASQPTGTRGARGEGASQPALVPLSAEYMKNAHALADRNVTLAGYRLADVLNNMFGGQ